MDEKTMLALARTQPKKIPAQQLLERLSHTALRLKRKKEFLAKTRSPSQYLPIYYLAKNYPDYYPPAHGTGRGSGHFFPMLKVKIAPLPLRNFPKSFTPPSAHISIFNKI
jgi:hypothetical protein